MSDGLPRRDPGAALRDNPAPPAQLPRQTMTPDEVDAVMRAAQSLQTFERSPADEGRAGLYRDLLALAKTCAVCRRHCAGHAGHPYHPHAPATVISWLQQTDVSRLVFAPGGEPQ